MLAADEPGAEVADLCAGALDRVPLATVDDLAAGQRDRAVADLWVFPPGTRRRVPCDSRPLPPPRSARGSSCP
jgi:hypothetical protein